MAINLDDRYPGRANPKTLSYPQGSFKNRTSPTSKDGTYLEQDWANDMLGFFQAMMTAAGITANGTVDTAQASQYFDALIKTMRDTLASTEQRGSVRLATISEAQGDANNLAVTPKGLSERTALTNRTGIVRLATGAEVAAGANNEAVVTPSSFAGTGATEGRNGTIRLATTPEALALQNDAKAVTPLKLGNVLSELSFGTGQAWQDVTANRNFNTTYTNSTSRPILVVHSIGDDGSSQLNNILSYLVDNETVALYDLQKNSTQIGGIVVTFVVPSGSTYRINVTKTSNLFGIHWAELR